MLYAVEYRNMHTAIHGLFVYDDAEAAYTVDNWLEENADAFSDMQEADTDGFMRDIMHEDAMVDIDYSEIDYRNVEWDEGMGQYIYRDPWNDETIVVVNTGHIAHDLYI